MVLFLLVKEFYCRIYEMTFNHNNGKSNNMYTEKQKKKTLTQSN